MRKAALGLLLGVIACGSAAGASASRTAVTGPCSKVTAGALAAQYKLGGSYMLGPDRAVEGFVCGAFAGPGSTAMAATFQLGGVCIPTNDWAVFRVEGGVWKLILRRHVVAQVRAAGSNLREIQYVYRQGDQCNNTGGIRARIWSWNGSRLVSGPWSWVKRPAGSSASTVGASFVSPSRNLDCEMDARTVICGSVQNPHKVTMDDTGALAICRGSLRCAGNIGEGATVLAYGRHHIVGPFRCDSLPTGIRCLVTSTGKGFLIDRDDVRRFG